MNSQEVDVRNQWSFTQALVALALMLLHSKSVAEPGRISATLVPQQAIIASNSPQKFTFRMEAGDTNPVNSKISLIIGKDTYGPATVGPDLEVVFQPVLKSAGSTQMIVQNEAGESIYTTEVNVQYADKKIARFANTFTNHEARPQDGLVTPPIQLTIADELGNLIPDFDVKIGIADRSYSTSLLDGKTDANGNLTLDNLRVRGPQGQIKLQISAAGLFFECTVTVARSPVNTLTVDVDQDGGLTARVGERFTVTAHAKDANGEKVVGVPITAILTSGYATLQSSEPVMTGPGGVANYEGVLKGKPQECTLRLQCEDAVASATVRLELGPPSGIVVIRSPGPLVVSGEKFKSVSTIRVTDSSANPIKDEEVLVQLLEEGVPNERGERALADATQASLTGSLQAKTDDFGVATFSDLGFFGKEGKYRIQFTVASSPEVKAYSSPVSYDPKSQLNRSYVVVSAIKSLAGIIPDNEFFDLRFRTRMADRISVMAGSDIALSDRGTDTASSSQSYLVEAYFMGNGHIHQVLRPGDGYPERVQFAGVTARIFNTLPYAGLHVGGVELDGSPFQGSSLSIAYLWAIDPRTVLVGDPNRVVTSTRTSILFDFFVRSSTIDFFKRLTIRGGVMIPCKKGEAISSRIAIAIPVGTIDVF